MTATIPLLTLLATAQAGPLDAGWLHRLFSPGGGGAGSEASVDACTWAVVDREVRESRLELTSDALWYRPEAVRHAGRIPVRTEQLDVRVREAAPDPGRVDVSGLLVRRLDIEVVPVEGEDARQWDPFVYRIAATGSLFVRPVHQVVDTWSWRGADCGPRTAGEVERVEAEVAGVAREWHVQPMMIVYTGTVERGARVDEELALYEARRDVARLVERGGAWIDQLTPAQDGLAFGE